MLSVEKTIPNRSAQTPILLLIYIHSTFQETQNILYIIYCERVKHYLKAAKHHNVIEEVLTQRSQPSDGGETVVLSVVTVNV